MRFRSALRLYRNLSPEMRDKVWPSFSSELKELIIALEKKKSLKKRIKS